MYVCVTEVSASPVPCPLQQKAYYFTYNNETGGFCRSPTSYVRQCAASSRLLFTFKHCRQCRNTFDRGLTLYSMSCLNCQKRVVTARYRKGPLLPCNVFKLLYPSIMVRTAPPVSVRVRTRVSVSFSLCILFYMYGSLR